MNFPPSFKRSLRFRLREHDLENKIKCRMLDYAVDQRAETFNTARLHSNRMQN